MGRTLYFLVLLVFSWFGTGGDCTASAPAPTAHTRQIYPEGLAERSLWGAPRQATARLSRAGGASFLQCFALTGEAQTPAGYGAAEQSRLVVRTMSTHCQEGRQLLPKLRDWMEAGPAVAGRAGVHGPRAWNTLGDRLVGPTAKVPPPQAYAVSQAPTWWRQGQGFCQGSTNSQREAQGYTGYAGRSPADCAIHGGAAGGANRAYSGPAEKGNRRAGPSNILGRALPVRGPGEDPGCLIGGTAGGSTAAGDGGAADQYTVGCSRLPPSCRGPQQGKAGLDPCAATAHGLPPLMGRLHGPADATGRAAGPGAGAHLGGSGCVRGTMDCRGAPGQATLGAAHQGRRQQGRGSQGRSRGHDLGGYGGRGRCGVEAETSYGCQKVRGEAGSQCPAQDPGLGGGCSGQPGAGRLPHATPHADGGPRQGGGRWWRQTLQACWVTCCLGQGGDAVWLGHPAHGAQGVFSGGSFIGLGAMCEPVEHSIVGQDCYVGPHACRILGILQQFQTSVDRIELQLDHTFWQDPRLPDCVFPVNTHYDRAIYEASFLLQQLRGSALAPAGLPPDPPLEAAGIEGTDRCFHFPSVRMLLPGVERDVQQVCSSQAVASWGEEEGRPATVTARGPATSVHFVQSERFSSEVGCLYRHKHPLPLRVCFHMSAAALCNFRARQLSRAISVVHRGTSSGGPAFPGPWPPHADLAGFKDGTCRALAEPCLAPSGSWPTGVPPVESTLTLPAQGQPVPRRPTELQLMLSAAVPVIPTAMVPQVQQLPPEQLAAYTVAPSYDDQGTARYSIFDRHTHARTRRFQRGWCMGDILADAIHSAPFRVRSVQVIQRPVPGYPCPQVILTDRQHPGQAIPVDMRALRGPVRTIQVVGPRTCEEVRDSIAQPGTDGLTESCVLHNSAGELLAVLQQPTEDHEWVALFPAGRPAMGASESTTSTTTEMLDGPPRLLGYEQAATQAGCVVPHVLTDARVWPPLVLTPPGVSVPVEQLHLLPGFSRIGSDGVTVPYSLLVQGYPPVTLFGSRHWTMADFCRDAVVQLDRRPSHIHFLTVPLPGLDSPQVLVTEPGQADSGVLLPLDLREVRLEVFPVSVEAGMSIRDILDRAAADQPALHDRLVEPWSQDRVFLQDCKGRVYDVLPPELEDLQWLVLRIRPPGLRAALPPAIPDDPLVSTTTSTTMMRAPGPTASIVIVCDGATVRSAPYPLENVPLRLILIDLLRSLVNLGRLRGPFTLQLAPVMSRAAAADHLIVPFLARSRFDGVEIFMDPGSDALQLHSLAATEGMRIGDALSTAQRQAGMRAYINGIPEELCRRPLRTGDYVVTHSGDLLPFVVRNIGPALDRIEELRFFSFPVSFPALGLLGNTVPATLLARPRNQPFMSVLERTLAERAARMGLPSRTWSSVWLLEPAHAPHRMWIDVPTAPGPRQAAELIAETGLLLAGSVITDADSDAEMAASAMFLVTRPDDGYETYTVSDPVTPLGYHLMHLTPGIAWPACQYARECATGRRDMFSRGRTSRLLMLEARTLPLLLSHHSLRQLLPRCLQLRMLMPLTSSLSLPHRLPSRSLPRQVMPHRLPVLVTVLHLYSLGPRGTPASPRHKAAAPCQPLLTRHRALFPPPAATP